MLKRISKHKHKCRHAFTLVELIVILVILAILAGILVPALTGYIKKTRKGQYIQEVDAFRSAGQSIMAEWYAHNGERIDTETSSGTRVKIRSGETRCLSSWATAGVKRITSLTYLFSA